MAAARLQWLQDELLAAWAALALSFVHCMATAAVLTPQNNDMPTRGRRARWCLFLCGHSLWVAAMALLTVAGCARRVQHQLIVAVTCDIFSFGPLHAQTLR